MKVGSLFSGIGGFDLAAEWCGWETAWYSEIYPYASQIMALRFPGVPNHGDITKIRGADVGPVDLLCGGFPCQDISTAGKGVGLHGSRSRLWFEFARLIGEIRPQWVVAENVPALRGRGLTRVLQDLDALGYDAEWHCIPASAVGAPHQRDRIWIVAYPESSGRREEREDGQGRGRRGGTEGGVGGGPVFGGSDVAYPNRPLSGWWLSEPDVGRVAHGVPARVDRLRCLGNALVPEIPYRIFRAIGRLERRLPPVGMVPKGTTCVGFCRTAPTHWPG